MDERSNFWFSGSHSNLYCYVYRNIYFSKWKWWEDRFANPHKWHKISDLYGTCFLNTLFFHGFHNNVFGNLHFTLCGRRLWILVRKYEGGLCGSFQFHCKYVNGLLHCPCTCATGANVDSHSYHCYNNCFYSTSSFYTDAVRPLADMINATLTVPDIFDREMKPLF